MASLIAEDDGIGSLVVGGNSNGGAVAEGAVVSSSTIDGVDDYNHQRYLIEFLESGFSSDSTIVGKAITFALIWAIGLVLLLVLFYLGCSMRGDPKSKQTTRPIVIAMTLTCGIIGLVSSFITLVNCEFLVVSYANAPNPNTDYPTSIGVWSIGYPKTILESGVNGDVKTKSAVDSDYFSLSINDNRVCYYAILEDDLIQTKSNDNSDWEIDVSINEWPIELSRIASIVATGIGLIGFVFVSCLSICNIQSKFMWIVGSLLFFLATIGQGLTLFLLEWELCKSEYECTLEFGAVTTITATFYWLLSVIGTCFSM